MFIERKITKISAGNRSAMIMEAIFFSALSHPLLNLKEINQGRQWEVVIYYFLYPKFPLKCMRNSKIRKKMVHLTAIKGPIFCIKLPYTRFKIPSLYRKSKTPGRSWLVVKEVAVVIASNTEQCPLIYRDNGLN